MAKPHLSWPDLSAELKKLGAPVDLAQHFNFIRSWNLIGPFDNHDKKGFNKDYPPEVHVDLEGIYPGKDGAIVRWAPATTTDPFGMLDLNKLIGKHMGAVAYAVADVESMAAQPVQIRVGSNNAVKIYLNGKSLFGREEYHHGIEMDQYVASGELKVGKNRVLLKVCQPGLSTVLSPLIYRDQVLVSGGDFCALRPITGKRAPEVVWRNSKLRTNYASGLVYEGKLYVIASPSMMNCVDAATGKLVWQERLKGNYWASPIGADGKIYTINEEGAAIVLKAGVKPEVLATNHFGEPIFATPAVADGRIYFRSDKHLFCVGEKAKAGGGSGR
jgi:outer membrane protein assembly factor BamB